MISGRGLHARFRAMASKQRFVWDSVIFEATKGTANHTNKLKSEIFAESGHSHSTRDARLWRTKTLPSIQSAKIGAYVF